MSCLDNRSTGSCYSLKIVVAGDLYNSMRHSGNLGTIGLSGNLKDLWKKAVGKNSVLLSNKLNGIMCGDPWLSTLENAEFRVEAMSKCWVTMTGGREFF